MVRDFINQHAVAKGWTTNPSYCVRVTANDGAAGENDLNTFCDNEKTIPTILTTSRKLSTGVDARNVRHIVLMRPCNNMIEFKQIIGRGTRMYEGKDYFTIYDFVKAHYNFADPEWDGEPEPPEEPGNPRPNPEPPTGGGDDNGGGIIGDPPTEPRPEKITIKLSDGKTRTIHHVAGAIYIGPNGEMMTANQFLEALFCDTPKFFESEDQLREIWSDPTTREKLLSDLAEAGYDNEKLDSMKELIDAKDSDVYDVLAFVAYAAETQTRQERAQSAKPAIYGAFDYKQQEFINFILDKYVQDGVHELAENKMRSLIELKYNTISDATHVFGSPKAIRETFIGFQKFLYK